MPRPFEAPPQTAYITDDDDRIVGTVTMGGEILRMQCEKKVQHFEMHSYLGPMACNRDGDHALRVAADFWGRYYGWEAGGKLVNGVDCVIDQE